MKTLSLSLAAVLMALGTQTGTQAQPPAGVSGVQPLYNTQSYYRPRPYMPAPWYGRYHASTAAEGYMRGKAAVIAAQGYYNRMTAEAWAVSEEARSRQIENHRQATDTYFAMRKTNRDARTEERGPRATAEDLARFAKQAKPDRPGPHQVNAASGEVYWPTLLRANEFAGSRAELDNVFARRVSSGGVGADDGVRAQQAAKAMLAELKKHVRQLDPMDYTVAREFIESLAYEAQLPVS